MNLRGRELNQGLTGSDVAELQTELTQLSYTVPPSEQQDSSFGTGTFAAVKQFQTEQGLPSTGIVDATTAAAFASVIAASTYVVTGTVSSPVSAGVSGLAVQLVDKNVGGDVNLTLGQTGAGGAYSLNAVVSPATLRKRNKTQPDLQIRVWRGTSFLAASSVRYNAPLSLSLNVSLPRTAAGLASEYESLTAGLSALYKGSLSALEENTERQDITFLANKSGWDARAVALAALADQFSRITAPALVETAPTAPTEVTAAATVPVPPTLAPAPVVPRPIVPAPVPPPPGSPLPVPPAPVAPATVNLAPAFFYALFRAGLPADANSLFRTPSTSVQAIWQQATAQGVIPQALASQVPNAVKTYQALAAVNLVTAKPLVGLSTLGEMLTASTLNAAQQTTFSELYTQFGDDTTAFWNAVSTSFGPALTSRLQLDGQLNYLSLNNAPLVTGLHAAAPNLSSSLDLVGLGYYDANKWEPLIGTSVPSQIPGKSADNYAEFLAAQVRLSYPTAVAGDQVKRGLFPITDTAAVATLVSDFLNQHSSDFAIGAEPVEAFIKRTKLTGVPAKVVTQIKRLQRAYQLTPDDQTMSVLLHHNLDSAYAITRYDSAGFQRAFQDKLGGAANAAATYARARHIYSSVLNIAIGYLSARQAPTLGGSSTILSGFPGPSSNSSYPVVAYPTLETLFGSLDYCTCEDCRSILSPAAYLVDLLDYLDQPAPSPGHLNPQTALFGRRPDLQYLPLTCDNTNTALPYIDVVNETLEYYVANQLSLTNFQGYNTDDTVSSAELLANPQFVSNAAYTALQSVYFPPPLPFNRPLALLRQLFQNMGAALPDVMGALRTNISTSISQTGTSYGEADILIEQLGISRNEYVLLTDSTLGNPGLKPNLQDLYGYPPAPPPPGPTILSTLQAITLQDFSRRTGVSYNDLVSILRTQFINPNAILIERLERLNVPFSTLQTLQTSPSTAAAFIAGLPAGLDARAYGGSTPADYEAVVTWVTNPANFARIMSIITLSTSANNADQCSGASFQFLYPNGKPLSATDFVKLIRFIRIWQKLGLSIEQTDDVLTALYPAADLPSGTNDPLNDAVNIPLLDSGFQTALLRIGVLFQVMSRLSLRANQSLAALLACWAPIGTVGDNALYQQMFGGPAIQREDPGANIATVGGGPNTGDTFVTTINSVPVSQLVSSGDTPATIAAKIAAQINATATTDPITALDLNQRIHASSQNAVVVIRAGFTLECGVSTGATEKFTAQLLSPLSQTAAVVGPVEAGDVLTATVNTVPVSYTVQAGDTPPSIASNIANAINNYSNPDAYSGLPLNSLLVAWSSLGVVMINSVNSGAPLSLLCSVTPGTTGTLIVGTQVPAHQTASVVGTPASGDVLTTSINSLDIPCTVTTETTATAVAATIATTINGTAKPDPISGMDLNSILHASANGGVVTIAANDPATPLTLACSAKGGMTYTGAGPFPTTQSVSVSGAFAANGVVTTTINAVTFTYTVAAGDGPLSIAQNIADNLTSNSTTDTVTNTPLNLLVSAVALSDLLTGRVILIITARDTTGGFNLTVSLSSGTYTAGVQPPPFADNGYGDFLADPSQTLFGHEPVLRAAFNLTGAEFTLIAESLQYTYSTSLTLNTISSVFRVGWLAHTLEISVTEFLLLRQTTGLDPFAPLDPGSSVPVDPPVIRFIRLVQALSNAGLEPVQVLYLLWNQDISGKSTPDPSAITGLAFALRGAFSAVAAQFTIQSDPNGTIAKGLMALVYGNTATDFYFGLLNNTLVTSIDYPNSIYPQPQPAPLQSVIDASGGRLRYDNLGKQLSFAGVLDAKTLSLIKSAITSSQNVPALLQALADLVRANSQMVGPFFTTYPELLPLYVAYASSPNPVPQKRATLLANFLPALILKRNQEQSLATVTAAAGTDPSFATALLSDATVLHSTADATAPIVNDLTALTNPGLAAQLFLSNKLSGSPDIVLDADPLSYAPSTIGAQQIATVSGKITANDLLTTVINGVSVPYTVALGDITAANVAAGIAQTIRAAVAPDPFSGLPLKDVVTATAQEGVVTVQASNSSSGVSVSCLVTSASAPPTYTALSPVPASQTATVAATTITAGNVLTTTVNTIEIAYTVVAGDTSVPILAANIAATINATATVNQLVTATSAAGVITLTAKSFGPDFTMSCSLSAGATETYTAGPRVNASQTATLSAVPPPNCVVITTINSVTVPYVVTATDTTLAVLATNIASAIHANTTLDSVTTKSLNAFVTVSGAGGGVTIATIPPGAPFTLSCSLSLGSYTLDSQVPIWQCAVVAGGIVAGDILSTTINATTVLYNVTGSEASLSVVAANIVATLKGTAALDGVVTVANVGGIITFQGSSGFTLTCSTSSTVSPEASASYLTGPQFPAWQATIAQGFSAGNVLTTTVNDASVPYTIGAPDVSPTTIAADIVKVINGSVVVDTLTGLPVKGLVAASSSQGVITFRSAGPAVVMSCLISAGATEHYAIAGELPARAAGTPIAGLWSGYLNAMQDGFYNLEVDTDPGAVVTLSIAGEPVPMAPSANKSVWANQGPISLIAGALTQVQLTITSLQSSLTLNWQSAGLGWQRIPAACLYSDTLVDRLQTAYVRFLKATSLAAALSLTADEIAFLGTSTSFGINTTDSTDKVNPGTVTLTPASMVNIAKGSRLVIDSGPTQEMVTVTATSAATFTAAVVNPHDGTLAPFPIVDVPDASTGHGWLNLLPVSPMSTSAVAGLEPLTTYTTGSQSPASQTATVGGTIKAGDILTTTINGVATKYPVTAADTSVPILAEHIAATINTNANPDPVSGLPLNQEVSASSAGAIITIKAAAFGPVFTLVCSLSTGAAEAYVAGPQTPASQTAILSGVLPVNEEVVTSINSVTVSYPAAPTDTTAAILASSVVKAINATDTVDFITNLQLNKLISASSAGGVITLTTLSPGAAFTLNCSIASFREVLDDILNFARIKAAVSPNDEQLLAVVENPNLLNADGSTYQIVKLTGWALSSLDSLLQNFFGSTQLSSLSSIENLRRVFDAFAFVTSCRLSAAALLAATTNAPTSATVASLQSALRALYAASDWLNVIRPINDALRIQQRDALVAYILQQKSDQYAAMAVKHTSDSDTPAGTATVSLVSTAGLHQGMIVQGFNISPGTTLVSISIVPPSVDLSLGVVADVPSGSTLSFIPTEALEINTADDLSEYLLVDVQTQPPVETSRIRLALSSVQLFIERILRNLEPQCLPTDIDGSLWTWMKRYRVWQANREVFLWTENYVFPELRDDQSPIFQKMMGALLQGDITDDTAAAAYLDYLTDLELVAKLEPCGLYYSPASGDTDKTSYVVARSAGAHRKYYFRQLQYGSWTPWTEIQIECEDMPITPVAWQGRLLLFWLKLNKTTKPLPVKPTTPLANNTNNSSMTVTQLSLDDFEAFGSAAVGVQQKGNITVSAVLCWSEFYNGKWQPQKSSDVNNPASLGSGYDTSGSNSFEAIRSLVSIVPASIATSYQSITMTGLVQSTLPPDALILAISYAPGAFGGFVMYNTHSLPVRWDDIQLGIGPRDFLFGWVPLTQLIVTASPGRTFYPGGAYTGGTASANFSINYWTVADPGNAPSANTTGSQNSLFGLNRQPRIVDAAPNLAGWDAPFFFEDRRNVFYVTTTEAPALRDPILLYGIVRTNKIAPSPIIPPLVVDSPKEILQPTAFATGFAGGSAGDSATVAQFVTQNRVIHAAIGSGTPVVYQGATLYPTGQAPEQAAISQTITESTRQQAT